jgi:hypothetical protein
MEDRKRKRNVKIIIIILAVLIFNHIAFFLIMYFASVPSKPLYMRREYILIEEKHAISKVGDEIDDRMMENDIIVILKNNNLHFYRQSGYYSIHTQIYRNNDQSVYDNKDETQENAKIITLDVSNRKLEDIKDYIEIYGLMDIWLYLKERELLFKLDRIIYNFGQNNYSETATIIRNPINIMNITMSTKMFEELYEGANVSNLPRDEQVEKLAEYFIKTYGKTGYKRSGGFVQPEIDLRSTQ